MLKSCWLNGANAVDYVINYRWSNGSPHCWFTRRPCRHVPEDLWFTDETYVKIAGRRVQLYRVIDQYRQVIDVLVSGMLPRSTQPNAHKGAVRVARAGVAELAPVIGIRSVCEAVGAAQTSYYRRHRASLIPQRPTPTAHHDRDRVTNCVTIGSFSGGASLPLGPSLRFTVVIVCRLRLREPRPGDDHDAKLATLLLPASVETSRSGR